MRRTAGRWSWCTGWTATLGCVMIAKKRSMLRHLHEALREARSRRPTSPWCRSLAEAAVAGDACAGEEHGAWRRTGRARGRIGQGLRNPLPGARGVSRRHLLERSRHGAHAPDPRPRPGLRASVAGDEKYGERSSTGRCANSGCALFLHAGSIELALPTASRCGQRAARCRAGEGAGDAAAMRRLFVFDWDGTLMDSVGRIVSCLRQAAEEQGWRIWGTRLSGT